MARTTTVLELTRTKSPLDTAHDLCYTPSNVYESTRVDPLRWGFALISVGSAPLLD